MNVLPWLGYIAAYICGGLAGFIAAALSCASFKNGLAEELEQLRKRNQELEAQISRAMQ